jgi:hypothetical protein
MQRFFVPGSCEVYDRLYEMANIDFLTTLSAIQLNRYCKNIFNDEKEAMLLTHFFLLISGAPGFTTSFEFEKRFQSDSE